MPLLYWIFSIFSKAFRYTWCKPLADPKSAIYQRISAQKQRKELRQCVGRLGREYFEAGSVLIFSAKTIRNKKTIIHKW